MNRNESDLSLVPINQLQTTNKTYLIPVILKLVDSVPAKSRASSVGTDLSDSRSVLLPTSMTTMLGLACSYSSFSQRSTLS